MERVVADGRRDSHEKAHSRGDEGFGDAGRDGGERGGFHGADGVEGVHDAPDGAEQPDERGRVRGGRQEGQGAREAGHFHVHALPERAAHVVDHDVFGVPGLFRAVEFGHALVGDGIQRGVGIAAEGLHGLAQVPGMVETVHAVGGLFERRPDVHPFTEHQGPTEYAHEEQDHEDRFGYQRGLGKEGKNAQIHNVTPWYVCIFGKNAATALPPRAPAITKVPTAPERYRKKRLFTRPVISVSVRGCNEKMEPLPHVRPQTGFDGKMRAV